MHCVLLDNAVVKRQGSTAPMLCYALGVTLCTFEPDAHLLESLDIFATCPTKLLNLKFENFGCACPLVGFCLEGLDIAK